MATARTVPACALVIAGLDAFLRERILERIESINFILNAPRSPIDRPEHRSSVASSARDDVRGARARLRASFMCAQNRRPRVDPSSSARPIIIIRVRLPLRRSPRPHAPIARRRQHLGRGIVTFIIDADERARRRAHAGRVAPSRRGESPPRSRFVHLRARLPSLAHRARHRRRRAAPRASTCGRPRRTGRHRSRTTDTWKSTDRGRRTKRTITDRGRRKPTDRGRRTITDEKITDDDPGVRFLKKTSSSSSSSSSSSGRRGRGRARERG